MPPPEEEPKKIAAAVKFMFGVVAIDEFSSIEGYLQTIDQLVADTVGEEAKKSLKFSYPVVLNVKIDSKFWGLACRPFCLIQYG